MSAFNEELLREGFTTAYLDRTYPSNLAYKPQFISNNYKEGRKVLSSIEDELLSCKEFLSVLPLSLWEALPRYSRL